MKRKKKNKKKNKKTASGRKQSLSQEELNFIRSLAENQLQELFRQSNRNDTTLKLQ